MKNIQNLRTKNTAITIIIIIIDLFSPLLQMSKGDTIYRFYTIYTIQSTGTAHRLAIQQVRYDHTKKINCGSTNCSLLTEYRSLLAPDAGSCSNPQA